MPATKDKSLHRERITITCSPEQKAMVDYCLSHISYMRRSSFILDLIFEAIANNNTCFDNSKSNSKQYAQFQISCTPQQKQKIFAYCQANLPPRKRSKWITTLIIQ